MTVAEIVPHATLLILCRRARRATTSTHRRVTELAASAALAGCFDDRERPWRGEGRSLTDDLNVG
jgi:hypothetical protein